MEESTEKYVEFYGGPRDGDIVAVIACPSKVRVQLSPMARCPGLVERFDLGLDLGLGGVPSYYAIYELCDNGHYHFVEEEEEA